jgi:pyrimidine operon attenuation protein/uracil phosphoribosyltransferase
MNVGSVMTDKFTIILDSTGVKRALTRIAHEILERNKGAGDLVLLGVPSGGKDIAERLQKKIETIEGVKVPVGSLDATLYRDDINIVKEQPILKETKIPVNIDNKKVILVDDVLFTGRTVRAAMDVLMDFGRPEVIQLAVLVDRGHRELPIKADYVGKNIPTSRDQEIKVLLEDKDGKDEIIIRSL